MIISQRRLEEVLSEEVRIGEHLSEEIRCMVYDYCSQLYEHLSDEIRSEIRAPTHNSLHSEEIRNLMTDARHNCLQHLRSVLSILPYVSSIRQHTSACVCIRLHTSGLCRVSVSVSVSLHLRQRFVFFGEQLVQIYKLVPIAERARR